LTLLSLNRNFAVNQPLNLWPYHWQ